MTSTNYKMWYSVEDDKRCNPCEQMHGKIYGIREIVRWPKPPVHLFCRCAIKPMNAIYSIAAELNGVNGTPWWLKHHGYLPERYITKIDARKAGWDQRTGNLGNILRGKVIGGDVYQNRNGHLPSVYGRTWFEADLHYSGGFRSSERVLYSSDGLVFVTYDHYHTFVEVI